MSVYRDIDVPQTCRRYVQRILKIQVVENHPFTIPAIPTGYNYIGWIPIGRGTGQANDDRFEVLTGQMHITGQLTTFDASYTLHGPCTQYLAKCTADGAYLLLNRNMSVLRDKHQAQEAPFEGPIDDQTFVQFIEQLCHNAISPNPAVEIAATRIEESNGNVSLAELAAELNMSERHLRRTFSEIVGISPKTFAVIRRVVTTLGKIAENPEKDIADIVYEAGFADQAHLTNTFKQYLRKTPARLEIDETSILRTIAKGA